MSKHTPGPWLDLLEAAQTVLASLDWEEKRSGTTYNGSDQLRAAIAAATGEGESE